MRNITVEDAKTYLKGTLAAQKYMNDPAVAVHCRAVERILLYVEELEDDLNKIKSEKILSNLPGE